MTSKSVASVGEGNSVSMNDDRSPLLDLMNCIVCAVAGLALLCSGLVALAIT
jgi:hypothetical protein